MKKPFNLLVVRRVHVGGAWEQTEISSRHVGDPYVSVTQPLCVGTQTVR